MSTKLRSLGLAAVLTASGEYEWFRHPLNGFPERQRALPNAAGKNAKLVEGAHTNLMLFDVGVQNGAAGRSAMVLNGTWFEDTWTPLPALPGSAGLEGARLDACCSRTERWRSPSPQTRARCT